MEQQEEYSWLMRCCRSALQLRLNHAKTANTSAHYCEDFAILQPNFKPPAGRISCSLATMCLLTLYWNSSRQSNCWYALFQPTKGGSIQSIQTLAAALPGWPRDTEQDKRVGPINAKRRYHSGIVTPHQ